MDVGSTEHRVGARPANVRAGSKQGDVARLGMIAADGEAVIDRLQTSRMTMHATVDACVHFRGSVLRRVVSHDVLSVGSAEAKPTAMGANGARTTFFRTIEERDLLLLGVIPQDQIRQLKRSVATSKTVPCGEDHVDIGTDEFRKSHVSPF